jgi:hypothetical protein
MIQIFEDEIIEIICNYFATNLNESINELKENKLNWWKLRESSLLILGSISNTFDIEKCQFDIVDVLKTILKNDLGEKSPKFLKSTSLWFMSKFVSKLNDELLVYFIKLLLNNLLNSELPIKLNSCRALSRIYEKIPNEIKNKIYNDLYDTLLNIIKLTNEDTTYITLDCLTFLIQSNSQVLIESKQNFLLILLNLLYRYYNDPLLPVNK